MDPDAAYERTYPIPGQIFAGSPVVPRGKSIVIESGDGCYLSTESGERYLDYKLGSGPMITGHAHPHIVDAINEQAQKGTAFYIPTQRSLELATRIVDAVPCADAIKFTKSGTEATFLALRIARAFTGRDKVLKFEGGYHGWHDQGIYSSNLASLSDLEAVEPPAGTIDSAGITHDVADNTVVAPYNDLERTVEIIEAESDSLACVIVEPIQRSLAPADGFLEGVRQICDEHDLVLIFDEVVTGFRLAWGGAQEFYGVEPDLATYGKAIGGGTPIAAVCGRDELMQLTAPSQPADKRAIVRGTMNGNPLSAAAGHAALDILEETGTYDAMNEYADNLRVLFEDVLADSSLSGLALGDGPVIDYAITEQATITNHRQYLAADSETKAAIDTALFDRNILKSIGGKIYISTEHGTEEFERTEEEFKAAVDEVS